MFVIPCKGEASAFTPLQRRRVNIRRDDDQLWGVAFTCKRAAWSNGSV